MSSTFGTILDAVSDELAQFNFETIAKGWFFDRTKALPACLIMPQAKEREAYSHFADIAHYRVALVMELGERDSSQRQCAVTVGICLDHRENRAAGGYHLPHFAKVMSVRPQVRRNPRKTRRFH